MELIRIEANVEAGLVGVDVSHSFKDQRRAYIQGHREALACVAHVHPGGGRRGEVHGGSDGHQIVFEALNARQLLVKAYTPCCAIDGSTLLIVARIPTQGNGQQSAATVKKVEADWYSRKYFVIDEISMVSKPLFAKLKRILSKAKSAMHAEGAAGVHLVV